MNKNPRFLSTFNCVVDIVDYSMHAMGGITPTSVMIDLSTFFNLISATDTICDSLDYGKDPHPLPVHLMHIYRGIIYCFKYVSEEKQEDFKNGYRSIADNIIKLNEAVKHILFDKNAYGNCESLIEGILQVADVAKHMAVGTRFEMSAWNVISNMYFGYVMSKDIDIVTMYADAKQFFIDLIKDYKS